MYIYCCKSINNYLLTSKAVNNKVEYNKIYNFDPIVLYC